MTISLAELLTILGLIVSIVGIGTTILWNLWKKVIANGESLSAFKLKVSEEYVKKQDMKQAFEDSHGE